MVNRIGFGGGCGCGCSSAAAVVHDYAAGRPAQFGGLFSTALNVAGSFVGDPGLGSQIASQAPKGYAKIKETPDQIAAHVAPLVQQRVASATVIPDVSKISQQAQQIAATVAPGVAAQLAAQGYEFAPGTVGAELQDPSYLNAFGGENAKWVLIGGAALAGLLLFKGL